MLLSHFSSILLTPCISWMGSGYVISVNSSSQITSWDSSAQILLKNGLNVTFVSRTGFSVLPKLSLNGFLAPSQSLSDSLLYTGLFMTAGIYTEMSFDTPPCTHALKTFPSLLLLLQIYHIYFDI